MRALHAPHRRPSDLPGHAELPLLCGGGRFRGDERRLVAIPRRKA